MEANAQAHTSGTANEPTIVRLKIAGDGSPEFEVAELPQAELKLRSGQEGNEAQFDGMGTISKTPEVQDLGQGNAGGLL